MELICKTCGKAYLLEDMHDGILCDACFELSMQKEDSDFIIYDTQDHKCFICGLELTKWQVKEIDGVNRAVCSKHYFAHILLEIPE